MPRLISREEALKRLGSEHRDGQCLLCSLPGASDDLLLIHRDPYVTVRLSAYPRYWGQVMIFPNEHREHFHEMEDEEWQTLTDAIRRGSLAVERILSPQRTYVAATGSSDNLPMTCPHIHFNIIPVYEAKEKPSSVLTWEHGVFEGDVKEWEELVERFRMEWLEL